MNDEEWAKEQSRRAEIKRRQAGEFAIAEAIRGLAEVLQPIANLASELSAADQGVQDGE